MNILIELNHPAHFHLYRVVARNLMADGHQVFILIKTKDILEELLIQSGLPYYNILREAHRKSRLGILWDMLVREWKMVRFVWKHHIDLLTGSTIDVAHVAWLTSRYCVNTGEDDLNILPHYQRLIGPFLQTLLSPRVCNNCDLEAKSVKYESYHELAYLHPHHFTPDKAVVEKYFPCDTPYFILRFSSLNAYHDNGIHGIDDRVALRLIGLLHPHGRVYITSERPFSPQLEPYRIRINPLDMHHVMAFATLYIGDSQTMAAEAAVLGVPFIRFNDFVGKIGYLNELENTYRLGYGIRASEAGAEERLCQTLQELLATPDLREEWQQRRERMLTEKIDYAQFLTWFIENYPESRRIMKEDPEYQWRFRT